MTDPVVASSTTVWYLSRASGIATLVLLTVSVLLGIATSYRWSTPAWPRFVIELVHRNVSLLVVAFLAVHVVTVVTDSFAPIGWKDVLIPFASPYRPIWLGLGALACDILLALTITSLLRHRIGFRTWRIVHWFAYLCWPLAVVHGLGTGSDARLGIALVITAACVVTVVVAAAMRIASGLTDRPGTRRGGFALCAAAPIVLAVWLASGPLASGWARRAGTPSSVLAASSAAAGTSSSAGSSETGARSPSPAPAATTSFPVAGFNAQIRGTFRESAADPQGVVTVSLIGRLSAGVDGSIDVELHGTPSSGGGIELQRGTVVLTGTAPGDRYTGDVVGLRGDVIVADLTNAAGTRMEATLNFTQLDARSGTMAGTMTAGPVPASGAGGSDRGSGDRG
jgi:DMSO/TMAO reductase YedYZ heme-binding membrane subunit